MARPGKDVTVGAGGVGIRVAEVCAQEGFGMAVAGINFKRAGESAARSVWLPSPSTGRHQPRTRGKAGEFRRQDRLPGDLRSR
jgi:hypothetical protein